MNNERTDVMIDLETLAIDADCVILSIGACVFDINNADIKDTLYCIVDIQDQIDKGRVISESTLVWWINQSVRNPKSADIFNKDGVQLHDAMHDLATFLPPRSHVWSNGASFDCSVVERLIPGAWPFYSTRDTRTILDGAYISSSDFKFEGTEHNALDDAIHQAKYVSAAWSILRSACRE